jgi:hypothetical protein
VVRVEKTKSSFLDEMMLFFPFRSREGKTRTSKLNP